MTGCRRKTAPGRHTSSFPRPRSGRGIGSVGSSRSLRRTEGVAGADVTPVRVVRMFGRFTSARRGVFAYPGQGLRRPGGLTPYACVEGGRVLVPRRPVAGASRVTGCEPVRGRRIPLHRWTPPDGAPQRAGMSGIYSYTRRCQDMGRGLSSTARKVRARSAPRELVMAESTVPSHPRVVISGRRRDVRHSRTEAAETRRMPGGDQPWQRERRQTAASSDTDPVAA